MIRIYYDGDCYFCSNYARLVRLRETAGPVELKSLRSDDPEAARILQSGINVNTGFVVEHDDRTYHGSEAFHHLNSLVAPQNLLSRILSWIGQSTLAARTLYPILVACRFVVLALQGRTLITCEPHQIVDQSDTLVTRWIRLAALFLVILLLVRAMLLVFFPASGARLTTLAISILAAGYAWYRLFVDADAARRVEVRLRAGRAETLLAYIALWLLAVNAFDLIVIRRPAGFVMAWPLLALLFEMFRRDRGKSGVGTLAAAAPFAIVLFVTFPGLYLAPFHGGIAGWTSYSDTTAPVRIYGHKFYNDVGEEIWFNHAFFQPVTQTFRFDRAFLARRPDYKYLLKFMYDTYSRNYATIQRGRLPHQWALGRFAYPAHNLTANNASDYIGRFAPDRIVEVRQVSEYYSRAGKFLRSEFGPSYFVRERNSP